MAAAALVACSSDGADPVATVENGCDGSIAVRTPDTPRGNEQVLDPQMSSAAMAYGDTGIELMVRRGSGGPDKRLVYSAEDMVTRLDAGVAVIVIEGEECPRGGPG